MINELILEKILDKRELDIYLSRHRMKSITYKELGKKHNIHMTRASAIYETARYKVKCKEKDMKRELKAKIVKKLKTLHDATLIDFIIKEY